MQILRYRRYADALVTRSLRLPSGPSHEPLGTELATLDDGYTYVSLPDGAALPQDQPAEIAGSVVKEGTEAGTGAGRCADGRRGERAGGALHRSFQG